MKRTLDIAMSAVLLVLTSPFLLIVMFLVWRQDGHSPFYMPARTGKGGRDFRIVKMRSMVLGADSNGVSSTSSSDGRITPVGHFIRKYKIDELTQLWNVLIGEMSLVGPRPQLPREVVNYTTVERSLLSVRPGITDLASIVFADEGEILRGKSDPDLSYDQLIRPWKSRLAIFYISNISVWLDLQILYLTVFVIFSRSRALRGVSRLIVKLGGPDELVEIAKRRKSLVPTPPPGSSSVILSRTASN